MWLVVKNFMMSISRGSKQLILRREMAERDREKQWVRGRKALTTHGKCHTASKASDRPEGCTRLHPFLSQLIVAGKGKDIFISRWEALRKEATAPTPGRKASLMWLPRKFSKASGPMSPHAT